MITVLPFSSLVRKRVRRHRLEKKFATQVAHLVQNPRHPGLNVELLEQRKHGIYSFRIDRRYRALFIFRPDKTSIEILTITVHYR